MLTVIIVIHLMLVLALIGVVLLQKSEGGGLVSSTSGFLTGRGTANVLTRTTAFLAAGFLRHQPDAVLAGELRAPVRPRSSIPARRPARKRRRRLRRHRRLNQAAAACSISCKRAFRAAAAPGPAPGLHPARLRAGRKCRSRNSGNLTVAAIEPPQMVPNNPARGLRVLHEELLHKP